MAGGLCIKEARVEFLVIWLLFAALIGWWADARGRSGLGFALISAIGSPILAGIILLVTKDLKKAAEEEAVKRAEDAKREKERREEHERQVESIKVLAKGGQASGLSVADELVKLVGLRDAGVLTPEEFAAQKAALLARG